MRTWVLAGLGLVLFGFAATLGWDVLRAPEPVLVEGGTAEVVRERPAARATVLERDEGVVTSGPRPGTGERKLPAARGVQRTRQHADGSVRDRVDLDSEERPHGNYVAFHLGGAMAETGAFEHGVKQGPWRAFHENGAPREEVTWDRGVMTGWLSRWDAEGRLLERSWMQGVMDGESTRWCPDGKLESRGRFAGGKREGRWEFWLPTGEIDAGRSGVYQADQRVGD
jgi:hypothetical protein